MKNRKDWWWPDKPDPSIHLGPGVRVMTKKNQERGVVEMAHGEWRVVRFLDKQPKSNDLWVWPGTREYIKVGRLREA